MNSVFDNFDLFCEEIYKEFKIDVRGGESEYKILGYMVYTCLLYTSPSPRDRG